MIGTTGGLGGFLKGTRAKFGPTLLKGKKSKPKNKKKNGSKNNKSK